MKIPNLVAVLPLAATLAACASEPFVQKADLEAEHLARVRPGFTEEQVRSTAGSPAMAIKSGEDSGIWSYLFRDEWGYQSRMDVTFDHGVVTGKYSERDR